jgi:site-specific recombinase XerC
MAKRRFFEVFDSSGNRVCEIIALDATRLELPADAKEQMWLIETGVNSPRLTLNLPEGFTLRLIA